MIYCSSSGHSPFLVNTAVSSCRTGLRLLHPRDNLWQNKQPFGPSPLSAVTLSVEICNLNRCSDDTPPSVVVFMWFKASSGDKTHIHLFLNTHTQLFHSKSHNNPHTVIHTCMFCFSPQSYPT